MKKAEGTKTKDKMTGVENRSRVIIRTSLVGVAANIMLAGFKAVIGMITGSIAITLDAVNNLSDVLSSAVTITGTRLAGREADKKHPLGHGRIEYLAAMIISVIVLYAGVTSFIESVRKIIDPSKPHYSAVALAIIACAVLVKILLGRYVKKTGLRVNSGSLIASGTDAMLDAVISASTLAAAVIYMIAGVSLEAYLGAVISLVIMKAGFDMLSATFSQILGERPDNELARQIKQTVTSIEGVHGAYDLVLHNYGPDTYLGSVHIEVPDTYTADMIDDMTRHIQHEVFVKHNVVMTAVGIYSMNSKDDHAARVRTEVTEAVMAHDYMLQMHGFYLDEADMTMSFDIIIDFAAPDRHELYREIYEQVHKMYPDYDLFITLDLDVSE